MGLGYHSSLWSPSTYSQEYRMHLMNKLVDLGTTLLSLASSTKVCLRRCFAYHMELCSGRSVLFKLALKLNLE